MNKTCFFSGHREIPENIQEQLKTRLIQEILNCVNNGTTTFISGGARGFDMLAADAVIHLQQISEEFARRVQLVLYLPCYDQSARWSEKDVVKLKMLKFQAYKYIYITKGNYTNDCMKLRNYAMVDASQNGIVYCSRDRSGTAQTIRRAIRKNVSFVNIAPNPLIITK